MPPLFDKRGIEGNLDCNTFRGQFCTLFCKRGIKDKNLAVANLAGGLNPFLTKGELKATLIATLSGGNSAPFFAKGELKTKTSPLLIWQAD